MRWIEFRASVLLFLFVPGDPESGAVYVLDRKTAARQISPISEGASARSDNDAGSAERSLSEGKSAEPGSPPAIRRRLPDERRALTHHFSIARQEKYLTVGVYDDGLPGEIFITMGETGLDHLRADGLVCHSGIAGAAVRCPARGVMQQVHADGNSNVAGFRMAGNGKLTQIPDSIAFLGTSNSSSGSVALAPMGQFLVVTEKATNNIDVFRVERSGRLGPIVGNPSAGPGVFALLFAPKGAALASETGSPGGAISSYAVQSNGALSTISARVPTLGAATCCRQ